MTAPWIGRWMLARHEALYDSLFFNADYDELGFEDEASFGDPNDIAFEIQNDPREALSRWSEQLIVRADLDLDPYEPPYPDHEEERLLFEIGHEYGLLAEDIRTILESGTRFVYFRPSSAVQAAVRRTYATRRDAQLERLDGPVHNFGKQLRALRYAWLELREDGSFSAAGLLEYTELTGSWRERPDAQLELVPTPALGQDRIVGVEYLGDHIHVCTSSTGTVESYGYRREPQLPQLGPDEPASDGPVVSRAQWWAYLHASPRLPPRTPPKRSKRKPKGGPLVLRPRPDWLRTPLDYLAVREGPWAARVTELDLCALEPDSEHDIKRVLGALSWPQEPWPSLARVRIPEGFLVELIEPFMRASSVFAHVELVEEA